MQEVESARQEAETHKAVATDREEKHQKVVKAARALKIKHDAMKEEKEREKRDLENTKGVCVCVCGGGCVTVYRQQKGRKEGVCVCANVVHCAYYLFYSQTTAGRRGNEIS